MGLNARQNQFAINYAISNNGTQSYLDAYDPKGKKGLSKGTAAANASKLLKNPEVKAEITKLQASIIIDKVMEAEDILKGIQEIATNKANKNSDRLQAFNLLGKAQGLFVDRVSNEGGMDIEVNLGGVEQPRVIDGEVSEAIEMVNELQVERLLESKEVEYEYE